jgi:hypothetical protein
VPDIEDLVAMTDSFASEKSGAQGPDTGDATTSETEEHTARTTTASTAMLVARRKVAHSTPPIVTGPYPRSGAERGAAHPLALA